MTKISEILKAGRARIADPANWTTGWLAKDAEGEDVRPNDPTACKFCAFGAALRGAIDAGVDEDEIPKLIDGICDPLDLAAYKVRPELFRKPTRSSFRPIVQLNDRLKSHADVLRAYDMAIDWKVADEVSEALGKLGRNDA